MIGLLFITIIGIWAAVAIAGAIKISTWVSTKQYRIEMTLVLAPLIFLAPVADEIIAWPQYQSLCRSSGYKLEMDDKTAYGKSIYYKASETQFALWPKSVVVAHRVVSYVDADTKRTVISWNSYRPLHGWLNVPAGSSGDKMTVLLGGCQSKKTPVDKNGIPLELGHLKLIKVATP